MTAYRKAKQVLILALVIVGLALPSVASIGPAAAQLVGWTPPRLVFEGPGRTDHIDIIADRYGQVHGFWMFQPEGADRYQIHYARFDLPAWPSTDVLNTNVNTVGLQAQAGDNSILVLWGGDAYGLAGPTAQVNAKDWLGPYTLGAAHPNAGLATGPDGAIWTIVGTNETNRIMVQRLDPATESWDVPALVASTANIYAAPDALRLAMSESGVMHAVWVEYRLPDGWPPIGVYYARSIDQAQTWSLPRRVAPGNFNQPNVITGPDNEVYITWVGAAGTHGRYFQESLDAGQTWSETETVRTAEAGGGSQGAPEMVLDSAGRLHMVMADGACIIYTVRTEEGWTEGECISDPVARGAVKEYPALAINHGNELHVLFFADRRQLWYTSRLLDTQQLPAEPTPTASIPTATAIAPTSTPPPTATYLPDMGPPPPPGEASRAGNAAIAAAIAPVVVLFTGMLIVRLRRRR